MNKKKELQLLKNIEKIGKKYYPQFVLKSLKENLDIDCDDVEQVSKLMLNDNEPSLKYSLYFCFYKSSAPLI